MIGTELLPLEAVRVISSVTSKKRLFITLGDIATEVYHLKSDRVAEALLERENLGPTGVGHGVALPHARLENLSGVRGIFLRVERPLDFGAVDRQPVDLVFALFAPSCAGVEHLKALAAVSRTLRNPDICTKLRANDDPVTLHAVLTDRSANRAA
ncbi:phosphotransferase IIA-like nitrogen-regulatory protein PtsN [Palleronia aestuarii]|uniref:Phosphotransferase IIA-like nitrogen-regulatory protein PtsN n=1 Tax=Palleronia aestuarii TaxID=568105 RepID=A0A2W7N6Y3_9RHOB|nr:PTS sugar transporter subunit IIA [Palleronia aestuarii]PZX15830.1 phosphotransferase IIA-like nitrogen-regulatory protein PtsN [Palleronia aestuarii]